MDVFVVCKDLLNKKNSPFRGNLTRGVSWDMGQGCVWRSKEAARPVPWEGRGEDLSPAWHRGSSTNPSAGRAGTCTGQPGVGKGAGRDWAGRAGVFAGSRVKLQFLRSHPAGTARRCPEPAVGEAPVQTCRDRGTGGAIAELFSNTVIAT